MTELFFDSSGLRVQAHVIPERAGDRSALNPVVAGRRYPNSYKNIGAGNVRRLIRSQTFGGGRTRYLHVGSSWVSPVERREGLEYN